MPARRTKMNGLLCCCCCPCEDRDFYTVTYSSVKTNENGQAVEVVKERPKDEEDEMQRRVTSVTRTVHTSYSVRDRNANASPKSDAVPESSYTQRVTRVTSSQTENGKTRVFDQKFVSRSGDGRQVDRRSLPGLGGTSEEVISVNEDSRKIDLPDWFLPKETPSKGEKTADVNIDLERSFAGMFDIKVEKRSPHDTRRRVYEKTISPAAKKEEKPALNLDHLETAIQSSKQASVEAKPRPTSSPSHSRESNGPRECQKYVVSYSFQNQEKAGRTQTTEDVEKPPQDAQEEVILASADQRKIDMPSWFLPNRSVRPPKTSGQHADIELQFSGLIKTEKREEPTQTGTEVFEEVHPVETQSKDQVLFLESLEGDGNLKGAAEERKRERPLDELFDFSIAADSPGNKRPREYRRAVYEKSIAPNAKKTDQPTLDLSALHKLVQRENKTPEASQSQRYGKPPDDKENQKPAETTREEDEGDDDDDDDDDENQEEIILVQVNRKLRLPKWFVPHPKKEAKSLDCLDELLRAPAAPVQQQPDSAPRGAPQVREELIQQHAGHRQADSNFLDALKNLQR